MKGHTKSGEYNSSLISCIKIILKIVLQCYTLSALGDLTSWPPSLRQLVQ